MQSPQWIKDSQADESVFELQLKWFWQAQIWRIDFFCLYQTVFSFTDIYAKLCWSCHWVIFTGMINGVYFLMIGRNCLLDNKCNKKTDQAYEMIKLLALDYINVPPQPCQESGLSSHWQLGCINPPSKFYMSLFAQPMDFWWKFSILPNPGALVSLGSIWILWGKTLQRSTTKYPATDGFSFLPLIYIIASERIKKGASRIVRKNAL